MLENVLVLISLLLVLLLTIHLFLFQMFKGPNQDIEAVFTAPVSAVCGVTLDAAEKKEYLISGLCNQLVFLCLKSLNNHITVVLMNIETDSEKPPTTPTLVNA